NRRGRDHRAAGRTAVRSLPGRRGALGEIHRRLENDVKRSRQSRVVSRVMTVVVTLYVVSGFGRTVAAETPALPELTAPVNDFAKVIDSESASAIDDMSRALKAASGDVVVVATVPTIDGYADIREYANKLFENHGRGIGDQGKNNGLLIVVAVRERQIWIEV